MAKFKDNHDREWNVILNLGTVKKVKTVTGFDFLAGDDNAHPILKLAGDVCLFGDVLWTLCESQAREKAVSEIDFAESLAGDSIEAATNALAEGYSNFCPSPQRRKILTDLWGKIRTVERLELDKAEKTVAELDAATLSTHGK